MENKKVSTTVYVTQEQMQLLKVLSERTKVPVAEYIRQGIDLVLFDNAESLPGQMSLLEDRTTTSKRQKGHA